MRATKLFRSFTFCVPLIFVPLQAKQPQTTQTPTTRAMDLPISGYRSWVKVNKTPHRVFSRLAGYCRRITPEEIAAEAANPHLAAPDEHSSTRDKWVTVFVNKTAESAMLRRKQPTFPKGSIIIKEKLAEAASTSPELLTIMRKREKGYNSANGDWEYSVTDGAGAKIQAIGKLQNCQSCHAQWKANDFVSREYLSANARLDLK